MTERVLELEKVGRTFAGVTVLRNVNLHLLKGEVHALLGENGAGKSTLIKILSGYFLPDRGGTIRMNGKPVVFYSPKDAMDASIHTIYQELTLCPQMTIAENIVLDKQNNFPGFFQKKRGFHDMAVKALERLGQGDMNPSSLVKDLSIAQQQVVEIAKAITSNAQIVLMDEPTSSISQTDADKLMNIIRSLKADGVTIIYISHRLHEIDGIADRITVLRDGDLVGTVDKTDVTEQDLIHMMVGRELTNMYPKTDVPITESALRVENLSSEGAFKGISFDVRRGEIFGIGGLVGSKRTELLETLFGLRPVTTGRIFLKGKQFIPKDPPHAIRSRIAFVTEDRKKSGLVLCLPVYENINLINAQKKTAFGWLDWRQLIAGRAKAEGCPQHQAEQDRADGEDSFRGKPAEGCACKMAGVPAGCHSLRRTYAGHRHRGKDGDLFHHGSPCRKGNGNHHGLLRASRAAEHRGQDHGHARGRDDGHRHAGGGDPGNGHVAGRAEAR